MTRLFLLAAIALSFAMMALKIFLYRPLLAMPGGLAIVLEITALLVAYASAVVWVTTRDSSLHRAAIRFGTRGGMIGGAIQMMHLAQEAFVDVGPVWNGIVGFGLLICTFLLWGFAGYQTTRSTGPPRSGALAGVWSAVVTMSILVLFGFVLEFYVATPKPEYVATWGEFKRSGWTDIQAFTIANTLYSAQSHLIVGPILGAIFGWIGGAVAPKAPAHRPGAA